MSTAQSVLVFMMKKLDSSMVDLRYREKGACIGHFAMADFALLGFVCLAAMTKVSVIHHRLGCRFDMQH